MCDSPPFLFPVSPPMLFCQAEDDLVLLAAIPLAVLDSTLCWWISSFFSFSLRLCSSDPECLGNQKAFVSSFCLLLPGFSFFLINDIRDKVI